MQASNQQRQQLRDICEQLSEALESSQTLGGSDEELTQIQSTLLQLNQQMAALRNRKMIEFYSPDYQGDFRKLLPCSPITGYFNPIRQNSRRAAQLCSWWYHQRGI